jgi:cbb3-type cytochrome oxidase subunit 3
MFEVIIENAATISTVLFFSFFCVIIFNVFKKGAKEKLQKHSDIPLRDDNKKHR